MSRTKGCSTLRGPKPMRGRPRANYKWTRDEDAYLGERYGLVSELWLARSLGRTVGAIREHAQKIGVTRRTAFFNACQVGDILGVDSKTVAAWIARGYIRGQKSRVVGSGRHKLWQVFQEDLEAFIREYAHIYDYRRIDREEHRYWHGLAMRVATPRCAPRLVRKWTPGEDAFILNHHGRLTNAELGVRLHRTKEAVHYRKEVLRTEGHLLPYKAPWRGRWKAGGRITPAGSDPWTEEQDAFLRAEWGRPRREDEGGVGKQGRRYKYITCGELAKALGKTKMACWSRAYRLGITKGRGHRTDLEEVEAA